jgi:hypothetical protein
MGVSEPVPMFAGELLVPLIDSPVMHAAHRVPGLVFDLPLCWVVEVCERTGLPVEGTAAGWEIADDHDSIPPVSMTGVPVHKHLVTCRPCLELVHA